MGVTHSCDPVLTVVLDLRFGSCHPSLGGDPRRQALPGFIVTPLNNLPATVTAVEFRPN